MDLQARTEEARVQETVTQLEAQLADTEEQVGGSGARKTSVATCHLQHLLTSHPTLLNFPSQAVELRAQNTILERLKSELEVLNQDLFVGETPGMLQPDLDSNSRFPST